MQTHGERKGEGQGVQGPCGMSVALRRLRGTVDPLTHASQQSEAVA